MKKHSLSGPGYLIQGLRMLTHPQVRWLVIAPVLINVLLFASLTFLIIDQFSLLLDWMMGYLPAWLDFLEWVIWILFSALLLIIYGYSFAIVGNLLASPFYGLLAERVAEVASGEKNSEPLTLQSASRIAARSFVRELKKLVYFLPRIAAVFLLTLALSFIPPLNLLSPMIVFLWGAWSLALQYLDYPADNDEADFPTLKRLAGGKRFSSFSFGGSALLTSTVPVFNMIAIPAAVAGATLMWEREVKPEQPKPEPEPLKTSPEDPLPEKTFPKEKAPQKKEPASGETSPSDTN